MKQGLLLTLKELIRLGVIKTKRRKRKSKPQLTTMSSMDKAINVPLSIQSRRYNEFISASQPPTQIPYTDNLRLRDEQSNFNTRLLEYKNQLENEKSLLENRQKTIMDDIDYSKIAVSNELQKLYSKMNRNSNWEDDNTDMTETFGSDTFKPQTDGGFRQMTAAEQQNVSFGNEYPSAFQNINMASPNPLWRQKHGETSSAYRMLTQYSGDDVSEVSMPKQLSPIKKAKSRGRPKSTIPLKERRQMWYQNRKAKKVNKPTGDDNSSLKEFLQSLDEPGAEPGAEMGAEPVLKKKTKKIKRRYLDEPSTTGPGPFTP